MQLGYDEGEAAMSKRKNRTVGREEVDLVAAGGGVDGANHSCGQM